MNALSERGTLVEVGGSRVNVLIKGEGPPVLLLHGSGPGVTAWANWRGLIPRLARSFRVIAPDMPGFGYTEPAADFRFDRRSWGRFVVELLDAFGISRAVLVGNSFGGAIAAEVAVRQPARVSRLVLMGPAALTFPITDGLDAVWGYRPSMEGMRSLLRLFVADASIITEDLVRSRYEASARPEGARRYEALFPSPRQRALDALALEEEEIGSIQHEVLVVHGRDDRIIPLDVSVRLACLIRRCELTVLGPCGHWVQIEQAERFEEVVVGWLAHR